MRQVLLRALFLFRRPGVLLTALLIAGGGSGLVFAPLFGQPGYELGAALALALGLLGGVPGIAAARLERRMIQGLEPRPRGALRSDSPVRSVVQAVGAACTVNLLVVTPPLITAGVFALTSTRCDPLAHLAFIPLLVIPSALIAAAVGVFCGLGVQGAGRAGLLYATLVLLSAGWTAWPIVHGPQVFAFNHFGGYLPGPLYDEALKVTPGLIWFRVQTLLWAALFGATTAFLLHMREGRLTRPHLRPGSLVFLAVIAVAVLVLEQRGPQLATRMTHDALVERLGGVRETEHFQLFFPRGKDREDIERLVRDLEFRHSQLATFLGGAPDAKIRVYVYRSPEEKQLLVGASRTQFAKPWRLELHLNDAPFPHPVLKHELAHVMAAPLGSGPFAVSARFGLWPNIGIIEGFAVAADNGVDELTLHEWSAGMRRHSLMPDIRQLLLPHGFYAAAPSRAYTAAGSFLRYLAETHGTEKLRALYTHGDFEASYGRTLSDLATEWERYLDALPLDDEAVNRAFARFRRGSLFSRPCAREVATLSEQAKGFLKSDPHRALETYERCATLQPDEVAFRLGQAQALSLLGRWGDAADLLRQAASSQELAPAVEAELAMARADLAVRRQRPDEAKAYLERALAVRASPAVDRTARVKLAALSDPSSGTALWSYFQDGPEDVKLLILREALSQSPENPYLHYLLGRRLHQGRAPTLAVGYLQRALQSPLPDSIRKEAVRLKLEAEFLAGDCLAVSDSNGQMPDLGSALRAHAEHWLERCQFEQAAFQGALVPEGPFR